MERYSRQRNLQQHESQSTLRQATAAAADATGLRWTAKEFQASGDGYLVALPPDTPEDVVVGRYLYELDMILSRHNQSRVREAKVRVRAAIHVGLVHLDSANGWAGDAVVTVCRLLNAGALRRALTLFPATSVAAIVSPGIFRDVVSERYDGIEPERFGRVRVSQPDKAFRSGRLRVRATPRRECPDRARRAGAASNRRSRGSRCARRHRGQHRAGPGAR
jgi:hypothetical protein